MLLGAFGHLELVASFPEQIGNVDRRQRIGAANLQQVAFGQEPLAPDEKPSDPSVRGGGGVIARSGGVAVAAGAWTSVIADSMRS